MSKQSAATITTPPNSFIEAPLTPPLSDSKLSPQVALIKRYLKLRKEGRPPPDLQPWTIFQLQPSDFSHLLALIQADPVLQPWFCDKVRYDYFCQTRRFILRMPTTTHEFFGSYVTHEIYRQLSIIANKTGKAAEFASAIEHAPSPKLQFPLDEADTDRKDNSIDGREKDEEEQALLKYDSHEPDAVFQHIDAQWPGIVIEVSYTQKEKDLPKLAENYILGSDGNIQVVIGLNIEYKRSKKATISVWRPQYIKDGDGQEFLVSAQTISEQLFRDNLGNPTNSDDTGLLLQLSDFASPAVVTDGDLNALSHHVTISSAFLYKFLTKAEANDKKMREFTGKKTDLKPGARKRKRTETPPDRLLSDDERRFAKEEEWAAKRLSDEDGDYVTC